MAWKMVQVPSWEPDPTPPGIWPPPGVVTPPIYYPPVISGPPGPWPTPPIHLPPQGGGGEGIWGPTDPRPTPPIHMPGPPVGIWPPPGVVSPPIYYPPGISGPPGPWPTPPIHLPGGGGGEGIWGPTDPRPQPPIHIPPEGGGAPPGIWPPAGVVSPPIYYPPGIWPPAGVVSPPIYYPPPPDTGTPPVGGYPGYPAPDPSPIFDPDDMPEHPELPDLNSGYWMKAFDPTDRTIFSVFVAGPVSDNPEEPVNRTPGDWVVVRAYDGLPAWAWRPEPAVVDNTLPGDQPGVDNTLPGDQPVVDPRRK